MEAFKVLLIHQNEWKIRNKYKKRANENEMNIKNSENYIRIKFHRILLLSSSSSNEMKWNEKKTISINSNGTYYTHSEIDTWQPRFLFIMCQGKSVQSYFEERKELFQLSTKTWKYLFSFIFFCIGVFLMKTEKSVCGCRAHT